MASGDDPFAGAGGGDDGPFDGASGDAAGGYGGGDSRRPRRRCAPTHFTDELVLPAEAGVDWAAIDAATSGRRKPSTSERDLFLAEAASALGVPAEALIPRSGRPRSNVGGEAGERLAKRRERDSSRRRSMTPTEYADFNVSAGQAGDAVGDVGGVASVAAAADSPRVRVYVSLRRPLPPLWCMWLHPLLVTSPRGCTC